MQAAAEDAAAAVVVVAAKFDGSASPSLGKESRRDIREWEVR